MYSFDRTMKYGNRFGVWSLHLLLFGSSSNYSIVSLPRFRIEKLLTIETKTVILRRNNRFRDYDLTKKTLHDINNLITEISSDWRL